MTDELGNRMKEGYENVTRFYLPKRTHTIIRADGKAFHTFTKKMDRPFDMQLIKDMQQTTIAMCEQIEGAVCGYTQSDEITILLTDFTTESTESWFKGNIQKMCSVSASIATSAFNKERILRSLSDGRLPPNTIPQLALFDSRVFSIPEQNEVINMFIWRQQDATRNSIQMVAQSMYSHKELHGKGWSDLNEMIFQKGINFNDYHTHCKRGSFIVKNQYVTKMLNRKKNIEEDVTRNKWEVLEETPLFSNKESRELLEKLINKNRL